MERFSDAPVILKIVDQAMQDEASYVCDNCGEEIVVPIDLSAGSRQSYVEDCPVCCHPHALQVHVEGDGSAWVECESL